MGAPTKKLLSCGRKDFHGHIPGEKIRQSQLPTSPGKCQGWYQTLGPRALSTLLYLTTVFNSSVTEYTRWTKAWEDGSADKVLAGQA